MNNLRKNLISTIVEECEDRNVVVSKDFVSFLLNLYELNPDCRIDEDNDETTSQTIVKITEKLLDQTNNSSIVTLKMQLYFAKHYTNRYETIKKHKQRLQRKVDPLIAEICETVRVNSDRDIEKLYQKILLLITVMSGLGNPMVAQILREAAMALQSVYLPSEVTNFVSLSRKDKEKQLIELMSIVAGIRLFNKNCQRGGEGIDDLPQILQEMIKKSRDSILQLLEDLMKNIYRLTAVVEYFCTYSTESAEVRYTNNVDLIDDVPAMIETLTACRQQEIYIRKLLNDVEVCENVFKNLSDRLKTRLSKLHDTVKFRTAIPIVQVYPQFIDLADVWMLLQDEVMVLSQINNFLWQLQTLSVKDLDFEDNAKFEHFLDNAEILTDAERLERSMGQLINECGDCLIIYPNTTKDFEQIHLEFLGFCAWTFVSGRGALIPGNPNIGVTKWRGKYFAFSSNNAASKFGEDPGKFFYQALDYIRRHPEYIHLFHLHEDVEAMNSQEQSFDADCRSKAHQDQGIQTELHVLQSNIEPEYHHSLWEHRRRALKLVEISNCRTRSTQTSLSHFKKSTNIQATLPNKSIHVQTHRESACNTKKKRTFIFGLRGQSDSYQHVIAFSTD